MKYSALRNPASVLLTVDAHTFTRISSSFGSGFGRSPMETTSGGPYLVWMAAFMCIMILVIKKYLLYVRECEAKLFIRRFTFDLSKASKILMEEDTSLYNKTDYAKHYTNLTFKRSQIWQRYAIKRSVFIFKIPGYQEY